MTAQYKYTRLLITTGFAILSCSLLLPARAAAEPQAPSAPVAITDRDLQQLSPEARKEVLELIAFKQANPERKPERIQFQEKDIIKGDVGPGGVDIQLLGGAIRIGGKNRRPQPKPVANYHPAGVPVYPDDLIITMVKRGNEPLLITLERGSFTISMTGEQLEQMIQKYKPYVVQMLRQALEQSGESPLDSDAPAPPPGVDLGAPASELGEPSALPESDLGKPSELPGPDLGQPAPPKPGNDKSLKEKTDSSEK